MGFVISAGTVALTSLGLYLNQLDRGIKSAEHGRSGVIDYCEVLRVWLPRTLEELARSESRPTLTFKEFKRFLESRHQEALWYAFTTRAHELDGNYTDSTLIRHPYSDALLFPEVLEILALVAGKPAGFRMSEFSTAMAIVMPDDVSTRAPREVIGDLLDDVSVATPE